MVPGYVQSDLLRIAHPPLRLRQFGFGWSLQQAGDVNHLAQDQTQPHRAGGNVRLRSSIGEAARQAKALQSAFGHRRQTDSVA
jgi:hypothetical protein